MDTNLVVPVTILAALSCIFSSSSSSYLVILEGLDVGGGGGLVFTIH